MPKTMKTFIVLNVFRLGGLSEWSPPAGGPVPKWIREGFRILPKGNPDFPKFSFSPKLRVPFGDPFRANYDTDSGPFRAHSGALLLRGLNAKNCENMQCFEGFSAWGPFRMEARSGGAERPHNGPIAVPKRHPWKHHVFKYVSALRFSAPPGSGGVSPAGC